MKKNWYKGVVKVNGMKNQNIFARGKRPAVGFWTDGECRPGLNECKSTANRPGLKDISYCGRNGDDFHEYELHK